MKRKILKNIEWGILICTIILIGIGLVALYTATYETTQDEFKKQLLWLAISIPIMIAVICINYEVIAKISPIFYAVILILLVGVLFTDAINGANSWYSIGFFSFQPSEFAKIFVILTFAFVISKIQEKGRNEINRPTRLILALLVIALPMGLIVIQPDLGTAMAFITATAFVLFSAGIKKRYIF